MQVIVDKWRSQPRHEQTGILGSVTGQLCLDLCRLPLSGVLPTELETARSLWTFQ